MEQNFPIISTWLGQVAYRNALDAMHRLREERLASQISDQLLFLEHPPVITMGRRQSRSDLKFSDEFLKKNGIEFVETDRGGKLTYHGPGQLVVYFIIDIEKRRLSIEQMVEKAEEGIIQLLRQYGIDSSRDSGNPGIWIGNQKIASLGFHVHRGVTTHGVALNVSCDLAPFSYFVPCGIEGAGVTSLFELTGKRVELSDVSCHLQEIYYGLFDSGSHLRSSR